MSSQAGRILYGINNIYTVEVGERRLSCGIKGKILADPTENPAEAGPAHNPLATGDWVMVSSDPHSPGKGWIESRKKRRTFLMRYNRKRRAPQILAANVDVLVCVTSTSEPPFRPRFIDRMIVSSHIGGVEPLIFVNKIDLGMKADDRVRLENYRSIGYQLIYGSALTGEGLAALKEAISGKLVVAAGQSGVGKSLLLNRLDSSLKLKVGRISRKNDRGSHTTKYSIMVDISCGAKIIDTPGIRELDVCGISSQDLAFYFPEFVEPAKTCGFDSCHHMDEPDCRVKEMVRTGRINPDRYESYFRMYGSIMEFEQADFGRRAGG